MGNPATDIIRVGATTIMDVGTAVITNTDVAAVVVAVIWIATPQVATGADRFKTALSR